MRITRLKLVNFIGIKHGLNETELEIEFPENGNAFTMLVGGNGSGKSTILSQLHPFKESFDDRKELIIPGTIGIKEIDIEHNGSEYKIKHIFDKTTSSFIEKDGEELNPNGKVRTFEDVVATELQVTKDYFKIGKIGSNTDNFVQFSTAQRKEYISNFVQDVEKYLDKFKVVSDKFKLDTERIRDVGKELSKYQDASLIKTALTANKEEAKLNEETILDLTKTLTRHEETVKNINEKIKDVDYIYVKNKVETLSKEEISLSTVIETIENQYSDSDSFKTDLLNVDLLQKSINEMQTEQAVLSASIQSLKDKVVSESNNKTNTQYKLNGLKTSDVQQNSLERAKELEKYLEELHKQYDIISIKPYIENNVDILSSNLTKYENFMTFVLNNFNKLNECAILPSRRNVEIFFSKDCPNILKAEIIKVRTNITNEENRKEMLNKTYGNKCANLSKLDILQQRPKACSIDDCPFISDALKYKNLNEEIADLDKQLGDISKQLVASNKNAETLDDVKNLYKQTAHQFKLMDAANNVIYKYQITKYKNITELLKLPFNEVKEIYSNIKNEVDNFIYLYNELATSTNEYNLLKNEIENYKNSETIRKHFESEINKAEEVINKTNVEINLKNEEFSSLTKVINEQTTYLRNLKSFNESSNRIIKCKEELREAKAIMHSYEEICTQKQTLAGEINATSKALNNALKRKEELAEEIKNQEYAMTRIQELNEQIKLLNESYTNLKLVKDALDPKSGIPLIFIQAYLGKTELIANELLNLAFNGEFEIHFISSAKDFFIQVRTGENYKSDIKLASQGEIALTTISISLALIEQSIGNFNILSLDEIDASLDSSNREAFISILNSQINKLGIEQVFIISHNNAFDSVPMNLIMLRGSEEKLINTNFMENKAVIYSSIKD